MKNSVCFLVLLVSLAFDIQGAGKPDPIVKQERRGLSLVVTHESGQITTNALFLTMSPEVKREVARLHGEKALVQMLQAVVAETRSSIEESATLTDAEIAKLYLEQARKKAVKTAISVGIREEIKQKKEKSK
jgi:uncharacterized protein YunC (DUF1805 family)